MENNENNTLYMMLGEIKAMLSTVVHSQETLKSDHKELEQHIADRLQSHSDRITEIEKWRWKGAGIVAAGVIVVPLVLSLLPTLR